MVFAIRPHHAHIHIKGMHTNARANGLSSNVLSIWYRRSILGAGLHAISRHVILTICRKRKINKSGYKRDFQAGKCKIK